MRAVLKSYLISYPNVDPGTENFKFSADPPLGHFTFQFMWLNGVWNGWATLPSGEVRQFGCIPDVIDWTGFTDYGVVLDTSGSTGLTVLGLTDLIPHSSLYLIQWGVD
jgi:hypothetical protein